MYSREIEAQEYTFGVSGKLIMNTLVMYDRQTNSLWAQLLGEAVDGSLKGTKLETVPALHTTWEDWKSRFPDTLALIKGYSGARTSYGGYYRSAQTGVIGETRQDDRLYVKEFVIGVERNGEAVAYPYGSLNDQPVINEEIGAEPVLVVFNVDTGTGVVFSRLLDDGRILSFMEEDDLVLVDEQTGSIWSGFEGQAVEGPLAGTRLEQLKHTSAFWFAWKDWYPTTRVYGQ